MTHRTIAPCLAVVFALFALLASGCSESHQARKAREAKERQQRKDAERKRVLSHYPSAVDFSKFEREFEGRFTIALQDAVRHTPESTYWIEAELMDVIRRGERTTLEFSGPVDGTSLFSLNCPEQVYVAITSDSEATQFDTYFIVFTLKAVTPTRLELRGEQGGEDVNVALDGTIGTKVFVGEALEVHRVSDSE
jgi:hypothetical protein